ncbi:hypothetical protein [Thermocrispum agreste]|nr:hypothetical protein [Thermocrispum agreste]
MSENADHIREILADEPEVDQNDVSKRKLEGDNKLARFRELMCGRGTKIYTMWRDSKARSGTTDWVQPWSEADQQKVEDLKYFHFGAIDASVERLQKLEGVAEAMSNGAHDAMRALAPVWEGDSGDAARNSLKRFVQYSTEAADAWKNFAQAATALRDEMRRTLEDVIRTLDESPISDYIGYYNHLNSEDEEKFNNNLSEVVYFLELHGYPGITPEQAQELADDKLNSFLWMVAGGEVAGHVKWLDDHAFWYSHSMHTYRQQLDNARDTFERLLNTFGDKYHSSSALQDLNPLIEVRPASDKPRRGGGQDNGSTSPSDSGGSRGGGGGSFGGGGGGSYPGGSYTPSVSTPSSSTPSTTTPSDADIKKPEDGTNPVTGKPLEIDPRTGKPYPIDPETGEPIKDYDDQDTTTVRQGDGEISVTEPSATGEMKVTLDDGKGGTKTYNLDFDPTRGPEDAKGDKDAQGQSVGGTASGAFGPQGSAARDVPGGKAGAEDTVHTPGEDGKIRIKDGDVEIVAQQPEGADGVTVVRVDDGSGEPVTQILGDEEAVEEYKRQLAEERQTLISQREALEARDNVPSSEWEELSKKEQDFRERGGMLPGDDVSSGKGASHATSAEERSPAQSVFDAAERERHAVRVSSPVESAEERSAPRSVFDAAEQERQAGRSSIGGSAMSELKADGGGPGVGHGVSSSSGGASASIPGGGGGGGASTMGGGAGGESIGGSAQNLNAGAHSGAVPGGGAPAGAPGGASAGGPGVGTLPGGGDAVGPRGGAPMMGGAAPMMAGAAGAGGNDESRSSSAQYQVPDTALFEPEVPEGPFGVARISGSLDDEEA